MNEKTFVIVGNGGKTVAVKADRIELAHAARVVIAWRGQELVGVFPCENVQAVHAAPETA